MVDVKSLDDVPTRVLDLLKIFLAASSRGERAVLVLDTRSKALTTKYRSLDDAVIGVPVPSTKNTVKKKSPASQTRWNSSRCWTAKQLECPAAPATSWS